MTERPPIGLRPHWIWLEEKEDYIECYVSRINEIREAISRYKEANKEIPWEWKQEMGHLMNMMEGMPTKKVYERIKAQERLVEVVKAEIRKLLGFIFPVYRQTS